MNEYIDPLNEKYNDVSFQFRTSTGNVYLPFFQKKYTSFSLEEKSRFLFENELTNNYHVSDFLKDVYILWNVALNGKLKDEQTVTRAYKDSPLFEYKIGNWLLNVLQCVPPETDMDTTCLSEDEKLCSALAFLQPNLRAVTYWVQFEINPQNKGPGSTGNHQIPENNLKLNDQFKFDQGFVKTFFSLTTFTHYLNHGQSFLLPLTIYHFGNLSLNGVNVVNLDADKAMKISFQLVNKVLTINPKKHVPSPSNGVHTLILDVTIFPKTITTEQLVYQDMCIDTGVEESCSTWFSASPIYKTGKTVLKFSYNISNVDIQRDYFLRIYLNVLKVEPHMDISELHFTRSHLLDYHIVYKKVATPLLATISGNSMMVIPQLLPNSRQPSGTFNNDSIVLKIELRPMIRLKAMKIQICVLTKRDEFCMFEEMLFIDRNFIFHFVQKIKEISSVKLLLNVNTTTVLHFSENDYGVPRMSNIFIKWENKASLSVPCFVNVAYKILDASKNESIDDIYYYGNGSDVEEEEEETNQEQDLDSSPESVSHPKLNNDFCKDKWMRIIIYKKIGLAVVSLLFFIVLMFFAYYLRQYLLLKQFQADYEFAINSKNQRDEDSTTSVLTIN